jgi:two-component system phosphate regulon sensor histidine kinase PhoR
MATRLFRRLVRRRYRSGKPPLRTLRICMGFFLLGVSLPLYLLFARVYAQLRQETLHQYRLNVEQVVHLIDDDLARLLAPEEKRPFGDYGFFRVEEHTLLNTRDLSVSPLSRFPVADDIPGLLGYFQIDPEGTFSTPILPDITREQLQTYDIQVSEGEYARRLALRHRLETTLRQNRFLQRRVSDDDTAPQRQEDRQSVPAPATREGLEAEKRPAAGFKDATGKARGREEAQSEVALQSTYRGQKLAELNMDQRLVQEQRAAITDASEPKRSDEAAARFPRSLARSQRAEQIDIPASQSIETYRAYANPAADNKKPLAKKAGPRGGSQVLSFEAGIDPIQLYVLQGGTLVFVRKVWRDKQRYIQGFVVDGGRFVQQVMQTRFHASSMGTVSHLVVSYRGDILAHIEPAPEAYEETWRGLARPGVSEPTERAPTLLYQTSLAPPFEDVQVHFTVAAVPLGPGATLVHILAVSIAAVLLVGVLGLYRLATQQFKLAEARQDFVAAVSHELKTPLTSIRMYGEMLRAGWVQDEAKRQTYYDFIFFESERLSRLVANVLHLARLSKNNTVMELKPHQPAALLDLIRSKVATQVEAAGFTLEVVDHLRQPDHDALRVEIEEDAFTRIFINLVDNAIKFAAGAADKIIRLELRAGTTPQPHVVFSVRDFGPGVERTQMKRIFQLFYRAGSELTRTAPGTGIGLALVKELASTMHAEVDLRNHHPGAEFRVQFRTRLCTGSC